jgi:hypothetical protein
MPANFDDVLPAHSGALSMVHINVLAYELSDVIR